MLHIEVYSKVCCPYCKRAKALLKMKGLEFVEHDVTSDEVLEQQMVERAQAASVPQIFINGMHIGGSDDLFNMKSNGELDQVVVDSVAESYVSAF